MIVAGGAADRQAEEHRARRVGSILDVLNADFFFDDAVLVGRRVAPHEPRRDELIERRIRQQVAGELLDGKPIERHVAVEGARPPSRDTARCRRDSCRSADRSYRRSAPRRASSARGARRSAATSSSRATTFAYASGDVSATNAATASGSGGSPVRSSDTTANERAAVRLGIGREPGLLNLRQHKSIDGRARPFLIFHGRQRRTHWRDERPVLFPSAPCSIQRLMVSFCASVSVLCVESGGIRLAGFSSVIFL